MILIVVAVVAVAVVEVVVVDGVGSRQWSRLVFLGLMGLFDHW